MSRNDLLNLIRDYRRDVDVVIAVLKQAYPCENLLSARFQNHIPKSGKLPQNIEFSFHGVGCKFEHGPKTMDVDFGPDGRHDGFDAWRLMLYAETHPKYKGFTSSVISEGLEELLHDEILKKPAVHPSPHLYYWR